MFCKKCGKEINDDSMFCQYCGAETGEEKAATRKNIKIVLIVIAAIILLTSATAGLYFLSAKNAFTEESGSKGSEDNSLSEDAVTDISNISDSSIQTTVSAEENITEDIDTSILQANLRNWGYGCEIGEDTYLNTVDALVRITKDESGFREDTVFEWKDENIWMYSDFVPDGNTIYYIAVDRENNIYHFNAFDISGNKSYLLLSYECNQSCYALNKIGNKIYYCVDDSLAYIDTNEDYRTDKVSLYSTPISVGTDGELLVTDSGVLCNETGNKGLKMLSIDGELIRAYEKISGKTVYIIGERNGKLFFRIDNLGSELYALDEETGEYSRFTDEAIFEDQYIRMNFYDDMLLISTCAYDPMGELYDYAIYIFSEEGKLIDKLELDTPGIDIKVGPCMLVLNDILYTYEPYTEVAYPFIGVHSLPDLKRLD